jgi:hypothetical protein
MCRQLPILCVVAACLCLTVKPVVAETVEVDVTIKSVDVKARGITVGYETNSGRKTIELDVSRKAKITVNGTAGTLAALGPGMKAKVTFDKELQITTKIEATGTPVVAKQAELVELSEVNDASNNDHVWPSADGLTIYWDRTAGPKGSIWMARRDNSESPFGEAKLLFSGKCPTVSSDGLEMILVGDRSDGEKGMSLHVANRESTDRPFGRPKEIADLQEHNAWAPCLSADGLTLYFTSRSSQDRTLFCTRKDRKSAWSKAKTYAAPGFEESNVSLSFLAPDGLTLFGQANGSKPTLMTLSRSSTGASFSESKPVEVNGHRLFGYWPRYVVATKELYFVRIPLNNGRWDKTRPVGLWLVKNYVPSNASSDSGQTRTDREVYRITMQLSEYGDGKVRVEKTSEPPKDDFQGTPFKLSRWPKTKATKGQDGMFRLVHDFSDPDDLASFSCFGKPINVAIDKSIGGLVLKSDPLPKGFQAERGAGFSYGKRLRLPMTVVCDIADYGDAGFAVKVSDPARKLGLLQCRLWSHTQEQDNLFEIQVSWVEFPEGQKPNWTNFHLKNEVLDHPFQKSFRLPLPNAKITEPLCLELSRLMGKGSTTVSRLEVRGHMLPTFGLGMDEKQGVVFAHYVLPNGLADKAGFQVGDVIVGINGQKPHTVNQAMDMLSRVSIGDKAVFTVQRGEKTEELRVVAE